MLRFVLSVSWASISSPLTWKRSLLRFTVLRSMQYWYTCSSSSPAWTLLNFAVAPGPSQDRREMAMAVVSPARLAVLVRQCPLVPVQLRPTRPQPSRSGGDAAGALQEWICARREGWSCERRLPLTLLSPSTGNGATRLAHRVHEMPTLGREVKARSGQPPPVDQPPKLDMIAW